MASGTKTVRAIATGVVRTLSTDDANALLAWEQDGRPVWEELTASGKPKKATKATRKARSAARSQAREAEETAGEGSDEGGENSTGGE